MIIRDAADLDRLDFTKLDGLLPVIAQHAHTGEVLMLAFANRTALEHTLAERCMWYWSRSRAQLWRKGDTSGSLQRLVALHADCDRDAVLALVLPAGPACHTGDRTCFGATPTLLALDDVVATRMSEPAGGSYTARLLADANLRLKKLGEEAVELALACARGETERVGEEAADLLYHVLVASRAAGVSAADLLAVLQQRRDVSGAAAAAARTDDTPSAG